MNRKRERLLVSGLAGLCLGLTGVHELENIANQAVDIMLEAGFVVLIVYSFELAIANGLARARSGSQ